MTILFRLLGLGSSALSAQHAGVAVAANNAANVNTPGYSRERVDLHSVVAARGGGVRAGVATRMENQLLENRARGARGEFGASSAMAPALADLENRLASGGTVDGDLTALWADLQRVSASPADSMVRVSVVNSATTLAQGIQRRAADASQARTEADFRIRDIALQATALASEIAAANANRSIPADPALSDQRDAAAVKLAELVGGTGRVDPDGLMRWVLPNGVVLVDGERAATMTTVPDPLTGFLKVEVVDGTNRRDVTAGFTSGRIYGELNFRDVEAKATIDELDQLAFDIATNFNTVHQANAGTDGVTGRDMFTSPTAVAGAAAAFEVDPQLVTDPARLATAAAGPGVGPGDNRGALALLALKDQLLGSGGTATLTDAAIELGASLGRRTATAAATETRDGELTDHLAGLRDSFVGVDIQEELANMVQFQHASEAIARFISAIDSMLGDMLDRM